MSAASRSAVREAVVQTVFECEFRDTAAKAKELFGKNLAEFGLASSDTAFGEKLLETVYGQFAELQAEIATHAPEWPYAKIARLDRAVLLVGLAELAAYGQEIPPAVTLNEYVEIAKNYGGDSARRFVNGVLSAAKKAHESNPTA